MAESKNISPEEMEEEILENRRTYRQSQKTDG